MTPINSCDASHSSVSARMAKLISSQNLNKTGSIGTDSEANSLNKKIADELSGAYLFTYNINTTINFLCTKKQEYQKNLALVKIYLKTPHTYSQAGKILESLVGGVLEEDRTNYIELCTTYVEAIKRLIEDTNLILPIFIDLRKKGKTSVSNTDLITLIMTQKENSDKEDKQGKIIGLVNTLYSDTEVVNIGDATKTMGDLIEENKTRFDKLCNTLKEKDRKTFDEVQDDLAKRGNSIESISRNFNNLQTLFDGLQKNEVAQLEASFGRFNLNIESPTDTDPSKLLATALEQMGTLIVNLQEENRKHEENLILQDRKLLEALIVAKRDLYYPNSLINCLSVRC